MFCGKGLASLKMGRRDREREGVESISCHIICNKGRLIVRALRLSFQIRCVCGLLAEKEKVSYLCGKIMSVKTCSSMHTPIGYELLPPSRRYGTSSAGLTTEEVVLLPKNKLFLTHRPAYYGWVNVNKQRDNLVNNYLLLFN